VTRAAARSTSPTSLTSLNSQNPQLPGTFQNLVQITYGTELACAGIDLLALRELMGHADPETTAAYVHLSPETLAAEYARARAAAR
jgi:integrase/recombinase XerC